MNVAHRIQPVDAAARSGACRTALAAEPGFADAVRGLACDMMRLHARHPRAARLVSTQQKWLLSQSIYALHFERDPADPLSGITATRLLAFIRGQGTVSRNTATAFLAELVAYRLLCDMPGNPGRRSRPLEPAGQTDEMMDEWVLAHMRCLNALGAAELPSGIDDIRRLVQLAQPRTVRQLLANPHWRTPPESVGLFVLTQAGALVLDDLIARITGPAPRDGRYSLLDVRPSAFSREYRVSSTHMRRVFARAEKLGLIGWSEPGRKGGFWLCQRFFEDYLSWQAIKLETFADALDWAKKQPAGKGRPAPRQLPLASGHDNAGASLGILR